MFEKFEIFLNNWLKRNNGNEKMFKINNEDRF